MRKHLLLLTVIFTLLISNVFSQTVYVTKTGQKYHNNNCRYLKYSSTPIGLSDAIARGYTACLVCKPPTTVTSKQVVKTSSQVTQTEKQVKTAQSVQCSAITKKGTQCKRLTKSPNGKCWQHGGD